VFSGRNYKEILHLNKECDIHYPPSFEQDYSPEVRNLLSLLLEKVPECRLSSEEALQHPWFKEYINDSVFLLSNGGPSKKFSFEDDVNVTSDEE
jgi:serine/threonine protein kinase